MCVYNEFQKEEKFLINDIIDRYFEHPSIDSPGSNLEVKDSIFANGIELIIRPECNQKCEYCYIHQHGKELYPLDERLDKKEILKNVKMILDFLYKKKKYLFNEINIFAGDLFYDDLFFDLMDTIFPYLENLWMERSHQIKKQKSKIIIPTNCKELILNDEKREKFKLYHKKFEQIGTRLILSWSTDGKFNSSIREKDELGDEYWEKGFNFMEEMGYGIHPMLSYESLDNGTAIQNYEWLKSMIQKRKMWNQQVPYLYVRNHGWTDERIAKYLELLEYIVLDRIKQCNNSIEEFTYHLFIGDGKNNTLPRIHSYDPIDLKVSWSDFGNDSLTCGIQRELAINVQNLSIVPCHRLTYPQFKAGIFKVENDEIISIEPNNISTWATIFYAKNSTLPQCYSCNYSKICSKGCLGAQFEYSGELLFPIPDVCRMQQAVISFLIKMYADIGVIKEAKKYLDTSIKQKEIIKEIIRICELKGYKYE